MKNLPNILTLARIAMLPVLIGLLFIEESWAVWTCFGLYVLAALTDFADGWLARKMNVVSAFGKFLDPIADKILVVCLLVSFVATGRIEGLWLIPLLVILIREFIVAGLREYLGPHGISLPVTQLAKWKTTIQMIAMGFLLIGPFAPYCLETGLIGLGIASILTAITGWLYLKTGFTHMKTLG